MESLLTQTLIVHIIRTRRVPFFGSRASLHLTMTTLTIMAIGAWLPYSPFAADSGDGPAARRLLAMDNVVPGDIRRIDPSGENLVLQSLWR